MNQKFLFKDIQKKENPTNWDFSSSIYIALAPKRSYSSPTTLAASNKMEPYSMLYF